MKENCFYEDEFFYICEEKAQIPWIKIFTKEEFKELSDLPPQLYTKLFELVLECEKALRAFYKPDKINVASFANYVPRVHIHLMARFKNDAFFPECMWGQRQREEVQLNLPEFKEFIAYFLSLVKR